jgi:hypothetical protein
VLLAVFANHSNPGNRMDRWDGERIIIRTKGVPHIDSQHIAIQDGFGAVVKRALTVT